MFKKVRSFNKFSNKSSCMKQTRLLFYLLIALLALPAFVFSQQRTLTGRVTDSTNSPLGDATVTVVGKSINTKTKADGTFTINVPGGSNQLRITYVGFVNQTVDVSSSDNVTVTMVGASQSLNEVVVIGYGTARRKDLTGSVASVNEKNFNRGTYTAPDQLIQGKVAGVQVLSNGGQPGAPVTVKVRGNSAVTGSGQPLYVVDGIPLDGRSSRPGVDVVGIGATPGGNPLNFINPSDIASMDVLKDASATAIYGSRAAYGVVIITTKRGQSGQPKLDVGASVGASSIMRRIAVLDADQYRKAIDYYGVAKSNDYGGNVNALDAILRTGVTQNYNVAISGGNDNGRYRLSTSLLDQKGIVRKSDFKKYTVGLNASFKFLESKKLGVDFNVISSQYVENIAPVTNNAGASNSLIGQALQWNPTRALKIGDSLNIIAGSTINPLAMSEGYDDLSKVTTVLGSVSPYYKITKDLEYRILYSINYSTGIRRTAEAAFLINLTDIANKGWAAISNNELITQQVTHTLSYNKAISSSLNLNAVVGYEYLKYLNKGTSMSAYGPNGGEGFGDFGLDYTNYIQYSNSANRTISSFVDPTSALQSYFGRAILNYKDRYLLTATFRADGSTKFGINNKYGYFPSIALGWDISKESFFKSSFIRQLKFRGSWGKTGNQEFPSGSSQARYSFTTNGGLGQVNNPNPDLKWQSDKQYNIGLDFAVLGNRLSGSVDYFNKVTTDLLFPSFPIQPAPPGSVIRWLNLAGEIVNKGFEIALNGVMVQGANYSWNLGANASFIKNNVTGLSAPIQTGGLSGQGVSGTLVEVITNDLPINAFYTRTFQGIDKGTGQAIYADQGNSFSYQGNPNPTTLLGITTSFSYKKLSLSANFNGAFGQKIYNNTLNNVINVGSINGGRNIALSVFEAPVKEAFSNPVTSSSRFIENGSYIKFANATLSYGVGNIAKFIKGANIYVTGQNLLVITKFTGFDPEVNVDKSNNSVPSVGIEYQPYPSARTITFGVNFSL